MRSDVIDGIGVVFVFVPEFAMLGQLAVLARLYFVYYRPCLSRPHFPTCSNSILGWAILLGVASLILVTVWSIFVGLALAGGHSTLWRVMLHSFGLILGNFSLSLLMVSERKRIYGSDK